VPPAFMSQARSSCGALVAKGLSVRWHVGPECGTNLHRDHIAALNIMALGKDSVGLGRSLRRERSPRGHA
jgi:putative transposase